MTKLVCFSVADRPLPPTLSRKEPCSLCGTVVWRALSSPPGEAICVACFAKETANETEIDFFPITPEQMADFIRHQKKEGN
jgi:hypothetical protein